MPHLIIEYSARLPDHVDMQQLCDGLHQAMLDSGVFPLGGTRVRAYAADFSTVADKHPDNAFVHMMLRMGAGRSETTKKSVGDSLVETARAICSDALAHPHFAFTLEIIEINPELSWKVNTIHARVSGN